MSKLLLICLSAGLHGLAFPPWSVSAVAWVAVVPFVYAIHDLRPRMAFAAGLLWGHATHWAIAYWVPAALTFYYEQPWWFGVLFGICGSPIFWAGYFAIFALGAAWVHRRCRGGARVLLIAAWWVSCELGRARLLSGAPWLLFGYALLPDVTLIQAADLGGVYLLSFLVVVVNVSLAEVIIGDGAERVAGVFEPPPPGARGPRLRNTKPAEAGSPQPGSPGPPFIQPGALSPRRRIAASLRTLAPAGMLLICTYGYGSWRLATPLPESPSVPVLVVQGNNVLGAQWQPGFYGKGLDQYLRMSAEAATRAHPSVIIWPEAAVTLFLAHEPASQAVIGQMLAAAGADLIVGAPHYEEDQPDRPRYLNSAFYVTADGRLAGRYDKVHLLPFAEYFPLRTIELLRRAFERVRVFTPGNGSPLLDTRMGKAAVVICFEAVFPELVRQRMLGGAQVLVNLSNDVWLGRGAGPAQHLAMVTLRAVENRTWVIRATTTGISAIIDPLGRVRVRSETFTPAVLFAQIVPLQEDTIYKRYGDWFAYGCLLACLTAFLLRSLR